MSHQQRSPETMAPMQRSAEQRAPVPAQRRARGPVQRMGAPLPPGVRVDGIEAGNPDAIIAMIQTMQSSMVTGGSPQFRQRSAVPAAVRAAFGEGSFSSSTISDAAGYLDDAMLNHQWFVEVRLNVFGAPIPVGEAGTGQSQGGTGGQSTADAGVTSGQSTTMGAQQTATGGTGDEPGGSVESELSASQTNTNEQRRNSGRQGGRNTTLTGDTNQAMVKQMIVADITVRYEVPQISGITDLDPVTVGRSLGSEIRNTRDAMQGRPDRARRELSLPAVGWVVYTRATSLRGGTNNGGAGGGGGGGGNGGNGGGGA